MNRIHRSLPIPLRKETTQKLRQSALHVSSHERYILRLHPCDSAGGAERGGEGRQFVSDLISSLHRQSNVDVSGMAGLAVSLPHKGTGKRGDPACRAAAHRFVSYVRRRLRAIFVWWSRQLQ